MDAHRDARPLQILLVEDDGDLRETLTDALREVGHVVTPASDGAEGLAEATSKVFDVVISDVNLPKMHGTALFREIRAIAPETSVIFISGQGEIAQAVDALKQGAYDYLTKPFDLDELMVRLRHIAERLSLRLELEHARAALAGQSPQTLLIGESPAIRRVLNMVDVVAVSDAPILITGESGTGKELVARMVHDKSPRRGRPFVAVNCGALADSLIEAELFGHERGAFSGADRKRDGRFKAADGGTLFLDEIAELSLPAQAKLLRVVQEGSFEALGSNTSIKVDVRIVSATHRDLRERIRTGAFREDLFFRIDVIEVPLPPLRERLSDLPLLVEHFLRRFLPKGTTTPLTVAPEAWAALQQHRFPGNVRELSHAIQHAVVLSGGQQIEVKHLPPGFGPSVVPPSVIAKVASPARAAGDRPLVDVMRELEREYLVSALEAVQWKRVDAARSLGISRKTLWEKMKSYGLGDSE